MEKKLWRKNQEEKGKESEVQASAHGPSGATDPDRKKQRS